MIQTIFIEKLICNGIHGLTEKEHLNPQRFEIAIRATGYFWNAFVADDLSQGADYRILKSIVREVVAGPRCDLLEALLFQMAKRIFHDTLITKLSISITKLDIWTEGMPGALLDCSREEFFQYEQL